MRRVPTLLPLVAALALAGPATAKEPVTLGNWNLADQEAVANADLLPVLEDGEFHGERAVAGAQMRDALRTLAPLVAVEPVTGVASGKLSLLTFDRLLVAQLGMADVADDVQAEARRAGLRPPAQFGDEVVARMLGLRHDHPYGLDQLELYPDEAITRAEAAFSLARAARAPLQAVRDTLADFSLPTYTARQVKALRIAVARIGMPYIWGGETDTRSAAYGGQVHGGYDCSGLVWRVWKLAGLPQGPEITGRTAAGQAGEIARDHRVAAADVLPGDLVFYGPGRFWMKATEKRITHVGIALSKDFIIQSAGSYGGVSVAPLVTDRFSWARRL